MGIALLIHFSMSCVRILLEVDSGASLPADGLPRSVSIVPATDCIFPIVHLFLGGKLWTHSELSPLGGIALS